MIISEENVIINNVELLKITFTINKDLTDYLYIKPSDSDTYVVVFHGHGSLGDQLFTREDIFTTWYPEFVKDNFGIIAPNTLGNGWMCNLIVNALHNLLPILKERFNIKTLIFIGGSMGGSSVLAYTVNHPDDVDAILTLCPTGDIGKLYNNLSKTNDALLLEIAEAIRSHYSGTPDENPGAYKINSAIENSDKFTMPFYLCHGDADEILPLEITKPLIEKMKNKENFKYLILKDGNHDAPIEPGFKDGYPWIKEMIKK